MVTQEVLAPPAKSGLFLVFTVAAGAEELVRDLLADLPGLTRSVSFRRPDDALNCTVGIGAELWDRLYDLPRPEHLHVLEEVKGAKHTAVSTPGDLLLHLRGRRPDVCFELARLVNLRLAGHATVVDEVHGFKFFDERDLLGFVDGTANPEGADAVEAAIVGADDSRHAGASYVIVQKYLHNLDAWQQLTVEQQELAIGRSKLDDVEMADADKPSNSHLALNTIEDADGNERDIIRYNMPFGSIGAGEYGTYFIGYAADPGVIEEMLRNMFIGKPPGNHDRILDFSTALTGALFFVPTLAFLENPA
jgi:porphyrinogen peroxidase